MANLKETPVWEAGVYQWETSDPVMGGENGIDNKPTRQLANRTSWLKAEMARANDLIHANQQTATQQFALKTTAITAGAGLTGGGVLRDNQTLSLGKPSKITATTTNLAVSNTHTHEIDKASGTVAGIVMLSASTSSTATDKAATPSAVKAAYDLAASKVSLTANQAIAGSKTFINPIIVGETSSWEKMRFNVKGGHWQLEFNPAGIDGKSLNFLFTSSEKNPQQTRIRFPTVTAHQNVAYESWVEGTINKVVERFAASNHTHTWASITGKPAKFAPEAHTHTEYLPKTGGTIDGNLKIQGHSDNWYGNWINNTNALGSVFSHLETGGITRAGIETSHEGNGSWRIALMGTAQGDINQDRHEQLMTVGAASVWTKAYGSLHDYFTRRNEFAVQATDNGYTRLPNGLILQWGSFYYNDLSDWNNTFDIAYPIAFPNKVLSVVACGAGYQGTPTNAATLRNHNFTAYVREMYAGAEAGGVRWFAIGF
ncbi:phage tail protein [Kingella negevensis]|uniref:phage tail protein n=2 Tax=Kingella TaxID=32257 RepID=UPI0025510CBD|nr:phage tail protein [Kingella negevensis]MDK4680453.1 phage tail protein [Kingella negevensis]MDK4680616.1 phage tail protein [Kingella negevensis]MDK4681661.1 phage tail protein [Kingella negevensis]MDK4681824.1 phage tail protein [Kingella negevensis]MDK4689859.1 phage tail protein [Kingella negevensis]